MNVELDVYSGRPNPQWTLSHDEARTLTDALSNLQEVSDPPEPGLGYRGFIVSIPGASPRRVSIVNGFVSVGNPDGATRHYRDSAGLERRLIESAVAHGYAGLLQSLGVKT